MKILERRALRGPNLHSLDPMIHLLLDIGELESRPSDTIPGFAERLLALLPGLREHRCSPGYPGGLVERLRRGTWAGHIVEHVALELQTAAGMDVGFGRTRSTRERGVYTVAYRYLDEEAGLLAGEIAVDLVAAAVEGGAFDAAAAIARLRRVRAENDLGPSTGSIVREAQRRGIPALRLNEASLIQLGHGSRQQRIQATMTGRTSGLGVEIADDKFRTKELLGRHGVPVPRGETARTLEGALEIADEIGYPVVVKPLCGNHGRGITTNVRTAEELRIAFQAAKGVYPSVVVERHLVGSDFRLLVIDHRLVAAARRDPAHAIGDGVRDVRSLIEALNADERRGDGHSKALTRILVDEDTRQMLQRQGLDLDSVPAAGQRVALKSTANLSSGGTSTDVTDEVHPAVRFLAERVSRIVGLDIIGLDIVAPHLREPLDAVGGGLVEVNAAPGFRMHVEPSAGKPRDVAGPVLDMLFPDGGDGRIPIVAVTGTNGKTTTSRLIGHVLTASGARVGLASTSGVEIEGQPILRGDYSGPAGAAAVLGEPTVDAAVLEVARGGILRRGLGFQECDVGVLLNVASDHLGEGGIETLEDLLRVKATVVEAVRPGGVAVLNADDPRVLSLARSLRARAVLFSLDPENEAVKRHVARGGAAVLARGDGVVICADACERVVASARDIPVTFNGLARFNVANVLAAAAVGAALGLPDEVIAQGLTTFNPTVAQLPGRMNLLEVADFKVLIDYGHNVPALQALAEVLPHLASSGRVLNVANGTGNRRDEDLREFGATIAGMYHHIFLCDPDPRGRALGETAALVAEGILAAGFPAEQLRRIDDEGEAIEAALAAAQPGDLVVLQVEDVPAGVRRVRAWQEAAQLLARELPAAPEGRAAEGSPDRGRAPAEPRRGPRPSVLPHPPRVIAEARKPVS